MPSGPLDQTPHRESQLAYRFGVAWVFLLVGASVGALLRLMTLAPQAGVVPGHVLHAHSHVAFLGWVLGAFFLAAQHHFVAPERSRSYDALWWFMQLAVVGMLASFPAQGYGIVSITFSTLHLGASAVFAARLWRETVAIPAARFHLRAAIVSLLLSAAGPLALGPLAALGLRDTAAYPLAIHFYLHFQTNGWFIFFLIALWVQLAAKNGASDGAHRYRLSGTLLVAGCVLSFALSALPQVPSAWLQGIALAGGAAQLAGAAWLLAPRPSAKQPARRGIAAVLWRVVAAAFLLKLLLQFAVALPSLSELAGQRFLVVAFLHLIALGLATPALLLWAIERGWLRPGPLLTAGVTIYLAAVAVTEVVLVLPATFALLGRPLGLPIPALLLAAALALVVALTLISATLRTRLARS